MAGDTFDAGTVVAESRLNRDQLKRDITAMKRQLAQAERDARLVITPRIDPTYVRTGIEQIEQMLRDLSGQTASPRVELGGGAEMRVEIERLEQQLRELGNQNVRPRVELGGGAAVNRQVATMSKGLGGIPKVAMLAAAAIAAIGPASWIVVAALQMVVTAAGGLAVIPAVLLGAIAMFATLKMATKGVGDALKAAAEGDVKALDAALKKLAPSAREFVLEVQKASPAWRSMRLDVQQQLFIGLGAAVAALTERYLPMLGVQLPALAAEMRETALQTVAFANGSRQIGSVELILNNTRRAVDALNPAFGYLLQILFDVAAVGSQLLPGLAGGFTDWAEGVAASIAALRDSGQLLVIMERGLQTLYSLAGAIDSIFGIIGGIMRAAGLDGQNLAVQLATVLQRTEDWINSVRGQEVIGQFFDNAVILMRALAPLIGVIAVAFGQLITNIGPALAPVATGLSDMAIAAGPTLGLFSTLAMAVLPALGATLSFLAPVLGPLVGIMLTAAAVSKTWALATGLARGALVLLNTTVAIVRGAIMGYNLILAIARGNISLFALAQWALNAAMTANPIGIVVVAIAALVAAIVLAWNHSETFRAIVIGAWEAIKTAAAVVWDFLVGAYEWMASAAVTTGQAIAGAWNWLVGAAQSVGSSIAGAWTVAWDAVVAAAGVVGGALSGAWDAVVSAVQAVGQWFQWLWDSILSPVFSAIGYGARVLLAVLVTIVLAPIILAVKAVGAIFTWLWENAIQPAWNAIASFISAAWTGVIQPVLQAVGDFITTNVGGAWTWLSDQVTAAWSMITSAVSTAWNWLLTTILQPMVDFVVGYLSASWQGWQIVAIAVWTAIQTALGVAWAFIRDTIWQPIIDFINGPLTAGWTATSTGATIAWQAIQDALGAAWQWILSNVWQPIVDFVNGVLVPAWNVCRDAAITAWQGLQSGLQAVWDWLRVNVFDPLANFVTVTIPDAFTRAVDGIKGAWDRIMGIVRPPIDFMVGVVYNEGIVPAWNWIAGIVGLGKLEPVHFATGGGVPGVGNSDTVPAMLTPGEYVLSKPAIAAMGGVPVIDRWHQAARAARGRGMSPEYAMFGGDPSEPGLAYRNKGGVIPGVQYLQGGGVAAGQAYARSQHGKPYQWAGVGNPSFDCSGFMSAITCAALGQPVRRLFSTGSFSPGRGAGGFVPGTGSAFVIGVRNGSPGHMAGNIGGMNVESGGHGVLAPGGPGPMGFPMQFFLPQVGGQFVGGGIDYFGKLIEMWTKVTEAMKRIGEFTGTVWGQGAVGLVKSMVDQSWNKLTGGVFGGGTTPGATATPEGAAGPGAGNFFDSGGWLPPGISTAVNRTGQPEAVVTADQWRAITAAPRGRGPAGPGFASGDQITALNRTMAEVRDLLESRGTGATVNVHQQTDPMATARAAVLQLRLS